MSIFDKLTYHNSNNQNLEDIVGIGGDFIGKSVEISFKFSQKIKKL